MRIQFPGQTIKSRLRLLSLALILLPPAFSLGFFAVYAMSSLKDKAYETLEHVLEYDKSFIKRWMDERRRDVAFLATLPAVKNRDLATMEALFRQYADTHDDVTGVVFMDAAGENVMDTGSSQRVNVKDRDYFLAGQAGRPFVSDILIGRTSGQPIIIFSAPVFVHGEFKGVVVTPVRLATVDALLTTLKAGRTGDAALLDRQGQCHAGSKEGTQDRMFMPLAVLERALARPDAVTFVNVQGERALGAAILVNEGKWVLAGQLPLAEVLEEYAAFLTTAFLGGLATMALLAPFLFRLIRSLERPMHELAEMAEAMAEGRFASACPLVATRKTSLWEVRILTEAFCRMHDMVGESIETLTRISITDQLTGLANRRRLLEEGPRIVDICLRGGTDCVCLMADVDHFKRVNDTWGHQVGDDALRLVAETLRTICRTSDLVARFGGEEFAIVAPNADLAQGRELAERLRLALAQAVLPVPPEREAQVHLTISLGVAACSRDFPAGGSRGDLVLQDALRRADAALYAAKQAGRNRVVADG